MNRVHIAELPMYETMTGHALNYNLLMRPRMKLI